MRIAKLAGRGLLLLLLGGAGYLIAVLVVAAVVGSLYQNGHLQVDGFVKWSGVLHLIHYASAAAFAWFFAGRRYWKHWKQTRVTSLPD